jgi:hypothetical protein
MEHFLKPKIFEFKCETETEAAEKGCWDLAWDGEKRRQTRHDDICSPFHFLKIILWLHGMVRVQGGFLRIGLSQVDSRRKKCLSKCQNT